MANTKPLASQVKYGRLNSTTVSEVLERTVLTYEDYADILIAAPNLAVSQIVESLYDQMRYDIDASGHVINERPIVEETDYSKLDNYTGRATRLSIKDSTGNNWWVRRGTRAGNVGTIRKDGLNRSWEREFSGRAYIEWFIISPDNSSGLQVAINSGIPLKLSSILAINSPITLLNNSDIEFSGDAELDYSGYTSTTAMISATGSMSTVSTTTALTPRWSSSITAPSHGLAVGDWFKIESTVDANSSAAGADRLGDRTDVVLLSEIHCVSDVIDSDNIRIDGTLLFEYVPGSSIKKITPVEGIRLTRPKMRLHGKRVRPVLFTLCNNPIISDMNAIEAGAEVMYRACFNSPKILNPKIHGIPNQDLEFNTQFIKIVDGTTGAEVLGIDLANGGQVIDITYTPGSTFAAPTLYTKISGGFVRNTHFSAIVDHPTCHGTSVTDIKMYGVKGAVYIRSRDGTVDNVEAIGNTETDTSIGVWAGENGFFRNLTVRNCRMVNFYSGYSYAGSQNPSGRTILHLGNRTEDCLYGERWGTIPTMTSSSSLSLASRHVRPVINGIVISGDWTASCWKDFSIEGPVSDSAILISGGLRRGQIVGSVSDIGDTTPPIKVTGSIPSGLVVDVKRAGLCGENSGLTRLMAQSFPISGVYSGTTTVITGTTAETVITDVLALPSRVFSSSAYAEVIITGTVTGSSGDKTIRLRAGASLLGTRTIPSTSVGNFKLVFQVFGTGTSSQNVFSQLSMDGAVVQLSAPASRTVGIFNSGTSLNVAAQLNNVSDVVTITGIQTTASWL